MAGAGTTTQVGGLTNGGGGGGGTVTQVSVASANGFSGTVATDTTTPTITIQSTGTSTRAAFANATSGLDYSSGLTLNTTTVTSMTTAGTINLNTTGTSTITIGNSGNSVPVNIVSKVAPTVTTYTTSTTAAIQNIALYTKSTSGTPAAGYGNKIDFYADTNGGTDRNLGYISGRWLTATDASRVGYFEFRVANNTGVVQAVDVVPGGFNLYGTTSGVVGLKAAAAAGTWTLTLPTTDGNANEFLQTNGSGVSTWAVVTDALLSTSDITTNDVSTTKHGFAPKAPNDATKYLDGTGAYSVPAGGGGGKVVSLVRGTNETSVGTGFYGRQVGVTSAAVVALMGTTNVVTYDGSTAATVAHGAATPFGIAARLGGTVLVGNAAASSRRSTDSGATWGNVTNASSSNWAHIASGGANGASTVWVMGATNATTNLGQRSTDDGATWSSVSVSGTSIGTRGIANDGGTSGATEWLAVMSNTTTRKSTDNGATWAAGNALTNNAAGLAYLNGRFVAWDNSNLIYYAATTGTAWTVIRSPFPNALATAIINMAYFNSRYYVVGLNGDVYYSSDITAADPGWIKEFSLGSPLATVGNLEYFGSNMYFANGQGVLMKIA